MNEKITLKSDTKIALLFQPEDLLKAGAPLHSLHIQKSPKGIDYTLHPLGRREISQHHAPLVEEARSLLLQFSPEVLEQAREQARQRYKKQKAGVSEAVFLQGATLRHLHSLFSRLIPLLGGARCYHKVCRPGTRIYQSLPCTFSPGRPRLRFETLKEDGLITLVTTVETAEGPADIGAFSRTGYFLQKDNRYHLLSYADYQTLEWLAQDAVKQWCGEEDTFVEKVLARLEKDYPVIRHHTIAVEHLAVVPVCRVLLTELNNSFLLLTPQFLYDGVLVDEPFKPSSECTAGGRRIVVLRHQATEQGFIESLRALHPNFATQYNGYFYLSFADAQKKGWFIRTVYHLMERAVEVTGMDLLRHFKYCPHKAETTVEVVSEEGSHLRLRLVVTFGKETVSPGLLQKTLWAGQRAVVLRDGSLGILPDEWLERYATIIKHGRISGEVIEVSRFLALPEERGNKEGAALSPFRQSWWDKWQHWQKNEGTLYPLPAGITATLRPYQQKGFEWLVLLSEIGAGACLADDMGLGKTLQTICFLAYYARQYPDACHLVVCPTSLVYNWQRELEKFAPGLRVQVYHGATRPEDDIYSGQVIITSYGTLRNNPEVFYQQSFGVAVLDESHHIKNPSAQVTRAVQGLTAAVRIALSGTPVVNNTVDLYSQLSFAIPGLLGGREFFKREYADPIDRWGDEAKIKELARLTAPFVLRRTKESVAQDLPPKTEGILWCTMSAQQEELYNEVKDQIRSNIFTDIKTKGKGKSTLAVLQGLLKLRQICNDPQLLPTEEHAGRTESIKSDMLMEELENVLGNSRVLVFSQFSSMLQLLARQCNARKIPYYLLDGSTPAEKRAQMAHNFQENKEAPRLFFISLKAGGTGLTLTSADYVFLFDPWWNRAVEQQAVDRTHRIGQTKKVFAYKLICRNTVEERILELQARKKHLAEELINEEGFVSTLTEDDIAYLFT